MHPISASDTLEYKALSEVQLAGYEGELCYTVSASSRVKGESKIRSSVWVQSGENNLNYSVSSELLYAYGPRWSPDSRKLGFIGQATKDSVAQLYLYDLGSGRLLQVTELDGELEQFEWSGKDNEVVLLIKEKSEESGDPELFEQGVGFSNLHIMNLETARIEQISQGYQVWEFALSPDNRNIAALVSEEPHEWAWHIAELALIDTESRELRKFLSTAPRQMGNLKWSPDGKSVFFITSVTSDRGLVGGDLVTISPFSENPSPSVICDTLGTIHNYEFAGKDRILAMSIDMSKFVFSWLDLEKEQENTVIIGRYEFWVDPWFQPTFSFSSSRNLIAVVKEDPENQQEIWTGKVSDDGITWNRQTRMNTDQNNLLKNRCELIEWISFDDEKMQGILYSPDGNDGKLPLIVNIHGGPSLTYGFRFGARNKFFLDRGFAVFEPNPRGSTGRGTKFSEMNRGNIDGDDFKDILAGIDYLVKTGKADGSNLFVMGGSYGGYLTAWAVTHSDIFNAGIMEYGISNLMSCHGTEWNTYWDRFIFDIDPYKEPEKYHRKSAINFVGTSTTPTLIMHGKEDPCVPVSQGKELFRALKEMGIETEMVIYPREKHGWNEREHIIDALERQLDWFQQHMKKAEE